jgi:hypothetical protein
VETCNDVRREITVPNFNILLPNDTWQLATSQDRGAKQILYLLTSKQTLFFLSFYKLLLGAMSIPTTHPCRLLNIPRELRDEIYAYYLTEDEGYRHHPETNTLRCFDGKPIDLALMYCCKQIAQK